MAKTVLPPSPPGHFLFGHLSELRKDLLGFYSRIHREQGDVALIRFGLRPVYLINRPDLIEEVLTSRNFIKHYALRMNRLLLGNGLLSSEGSFWLRQRRLIQPAFNRGHLEGYAETIKSYSERRASMWEPGQVRLIHEDIRQLTMEIAAKTLFGADVDREGPIVAQALIDVMESFSSRLFSLLRLPESFPTPRNIRAWGAIRRLDQILYGIIQKNRNQQERDDLLSILLHARDDQDGKGMTDKQLRDEAMTLFLAGHETTALALTYTLWLLGRHPQIQDQIRQEVAGIAADRPLAASDYPRLKYTEKVVLEGMRLYPPAYAIGRQAMEPCQLGSFSIPKDSTLLMIQWVVHRDPAWWPNPEEFRPERWEEAEVRSRPRFAYFPFGGGPRICIGNQFAMMEAVLVLAILVSKWRFRSITPELKFRPRLTLAPAHPVELLVEKP
ncbi:MAG: cytochrome P450 [Gemmataceae bacterium]